TPAPRCGGRGRRRGAAQALVDAIAVPSDEDACEVRAWWAGERRDVATTAADQPVGTSIGRAELPRAGRRPLLGLRMWPDRWPRERAARARPQPPGGTA